MDISIRTEQEKDYRRVEEVTRATFSYPERMERGGIGCPYEHWMVHELRTRDGIPELSLVAEVDNIVVGHIICSKAEVRTSNSIILNLGSKRLLHGRLPIRMGIIIRHLWEWNLFLVIYHVQRVGNIMNQIFMMITLIVIK